MKRIVSIALGLVPLFASSQPRFSLGTDVSVMRNFSPQQEFFAVGQSVVANFHLSPRGTAYAWLSYYGRGRFRNHFMAQAQSPSTTPQQTKVQVNALWRTNEVSLGWKHFLRGSFDNKHSWSLYTITGFGLAFVSVENEYRPALDTAAYRLNGPLPGTSSFKRLTIDLGLGLDYHLGSFVYAYGDLRSWIPTSAYPSPYLHRNQQVPLPLSISLGLRILFGFDY